MKVLFDVYPLCGTCHPFDENDVPYIQMVASAPTPLTTGCQLCGDEAEFDRFWGGVSKQLYRQKYSLQWMTRLNDIEWDYDPMGGLHE